MPMSRREFTRLLAVSGSAAWFPAPAMARGANADDFGLVTAPLPQTARRDEAFWRDEVRTRFLLPRDLNFLNAANLCPTSLPAATALEKHARRYDAEPSPEVRTELMSVREKVRAALAAALRVTPEEIVLTRNTTESNNIVSSGLDLKAGDEVVVWEDNHPSNLNAWRAKAARFGFTVVSVPVPSAHHGAGYYVEMFNKAFTPRTKLVAITHVSSNSGDLLPAREICASARQRGILSLVDGAQTFGVLDVNLADIKPDFYSGSMHKWPCGPREKGVFFASQAVHARIQPSIVGVYGGQIGLSRTFESSGQRDDASMASMLDALEFQGSIGRAAIEARARQLAAALMDGLTKLPGVKLWTDPAPEKSAAIVIFQPGTLDPRRLLTALRDEHKVVATARPGAHNPGLRLAPHFYNTMDEVDRAVAAIAGYLKRGV